MQDRGTVLIWVCVDNPFNSLHLQAKALAGQLAQLGCVTVFVHPGVADGWKRIRAQLAMGGRVIWHYGGFDPYLLRLQKSDFRTVRLVFHNITPARYYWHVEPIVAVGSLVGQVQLANIPRSAQWVTCSDYNKGILNAFGFTNVRLCPNIIDRLPASKQDRASNELLFVGRIAPSKRCLDLVRQVRHASELLGREIRLTIIGNAKEGLGYGMVFGSYIKHQSNHPFLRVNWLRESIGYGELVRHYAKTTLYVSSSAHEGFGLPVCEAILCGSAAVYMPCGGTESILHDVGMVNDRNGNSLGQMVAMLLDDNAAREDLRWRQRAIVGAFTPPIVTESIKNAYTEWLQ